MIRAFLAVPASPEVKERYARGFHEWRQTIRGVKWVEPENLHITMRFLGDTEERRLEPLRLDTEAALSELKPFRARIGAPGAFGGGAAPRVLWFGVDDGARELEETARRLETVARSAGFPKDAKSFSSHLTVARNKRGGRVPGWKEALEKSGISGLDLDVDGVSLLSSTLLQQGPIYTTVWKARLGLSSRAPE